MSTNALPNNSQGIQNYVSGTLSPNTSSSTMSAVVPGVSQSFVQDWLAVDSNQGLANVASGNGVGSALQYSNTGSYNPEVSNGPAPATWSNAGVVGQGTNAISVTKATAGAVGITRNPALFTDSKMR